MASASLDTVAAALVVALSAAPAGATSPEAIRIMSAVAANDRIDVANAAIDLGGNFDSINKTLDAAGTDSTVVGDVTPTYVTCETASPETIIGWKMPCVIGTDGKYHTPTGGLPFIPTGADGAPQIPSTVGRWAFLFAVLGGVTLGAATRYARTRRRRA